MAISANRRAVMTLFSTANDMYCHQVRMVLAEKGVTVDIIQVSTDSLPEDVYEVNPYGSLPTLMDRDLALFKADIINEYLDERFPHPPLMPVYPVARANARLMMHRIEKDWYGLADKILKNAPDAAIARRDLREGLLAMAPLFQEHPYFMSEEYSLIDCYLAALLWRLPLLDIELTGTGSKLLQTYMTRIFERDGFQQSLTEAEREIRRGRGY
ncbi:MAG: stringent starvation protein A [Gammaproteobacteria bacterium]|jgi:RNA polymerase-associated protein|uniref:RNA polymerase-associated protein n=1 Tax=Rheinheimera soli TaxID=443616 RepID=A0ABU1VZG3_9GAMM|nr:MULTISPECIES: stringent starvation protein SspA [Rheinheimera]MBU1621328.1 stringent starvation protein A [Gammaproteobacteria bacterium]EGM76871.1 glutathione S-transferase [Rheinheimera sp. A13L]MBU2057575.1 stringent starvation protein A [Gammaproteobacteria bacterium]MBU2176335.1 stringent starvation protein A [Gammaproteobacteria bacterium]MBU2245936.1 stringent starvation protein A [Gammaproteobacteria bacterium]